MNILSLFDGMSCGRIALKELGIPVTNYIAYEIDANAIKNTQYNFSDTKQMGDVFKADFKQYEGKIDIMMGGSPCTYWSIAQKNNREVVASGKGWDLFSQYVRALHEVKPKYFLYENNVSMSKAIKQCITSAFGFEPIKINSGLVSAQNRERFYWVGKLNSRGVYDQVIISQPRDRGITVSDVYGKEAYCVASRGRQTISGSTAWVQQFEARGDGKTNVLTRISKDNIIAERIPNYVDGAYVVRDGRIKDKDRYYDIKLPDGCYMLKKVEVWFGKRLQTVPDWYKFVVSDTQALKLLGNGWTIEVIKHIINCMK